jgi:hypothetical protein
VLVEEWEKEYDVKLVEDNYNNKVAEVEDEEYLPNDRSEDARS